MRSYNSNDEGLFDHVLPFLILLVAVNTVLFAVLRVLFILI
jgi:hypothetical protein